VILLNKNKKKTEKNNLQARRTLKINSFFMIDKSKSEFLNSQNLNFN
jgi:hypothetical protein